MIKKTEHIKSKSAKEVSAITPLVVAFGGLACLAGLALLAHWLAGDDEKNGQGNLSSLGGRVVATTKRFNCVGSTYPLQYGTCHPDVKILQEHLKKAGADLGNTGSNHDGVDGQFGARTQSAAQKYLDKEIFTILDIQNIRKQTQTT